MVQKRGFLNYEMHTISKGIFTKSITTREKADLSKNLKRKLRVTTNSSMTIKLQFVGGGGGGGNVIYMYCYEV